MKFPPRSLSFSDRLALAATGLALVVIVALGGASYYALKRQIVASTETALRHESVLLGERYEGLLNAADRHLAALARNPLIANALVDSAGRDAYLAPFLRDLRDINRLPVRVILVDFQGRPLAEGRPGAGQDIPMTWLREAIERNKAAARIEHRDDASVLMIVHPVVFANTGTAEGALVLIVALNDLVRLDPLDSVPAPHAHLEFRETPDGPRRDLMVGRGLMTSLSHARPLTVEPALAPLEFAVRVFADDKAMSQPLDLLLYAFLFIGLVAIQLVIGLSRLGAKRLTRRLDHLALAAAQVVNSRSLDERFPTAGDDEIARLGQSFNRMMDRLQAVYASQERESRRELQRAEARFGTIFRQAGLGILISDSQGRLQLVNPALSRMLGYGPGELEGKDLIAISHPDDRDRSALFLRHLLEGRTDRYEIEKRYLTKNGQTMWAHAIVTAVREEEDRLTFVIAMIQDVGERHRAEETIAGLLQHNQSILDAMGEGVYGLDLEGRATFLNPAGEAMLGWAAKDFVGKPAHELIHHSKSDGSPYPPKECPVHRVNADGETRRVPNDIFWHKDGRAIPVEYVATPMMRLGQVAGTVVVFRDISGRMEAEAEIHRSNAELEQFAYAISHDLQEPLRMVASYVQLLDRRFHDSLDTDSREFIAFAVDGAKRMQQMINDLLDYSRIQRKGSPLGPTPLDQAFQGALANLELAITEAGATVTADPLPVVEGDASQLLRLLQNLIGNAVKYRAKDRPATVHVSARRDGLFLTIRVTDNGIGIAPEHFERIFRVFQRLHRREEYPGTGIGLAIARRIVERHGGHIWVDSVPGQGSTFAFTLRPAAD